MCNTLLKSHTLCLWWLIQDRACDGSNYTYRFCTIEFEDMSAQHDFHWDSGNRHFRWVESHLCWMDMLWMSLQSTILWLPLQMIHVLYPMSLSLPYPLPHFILLLLNPSFVSKSVTLYSASHITHSSNVSTVSSFCFSYSHLWNITSRFSVNLCCKMVYRTHFWAPRVVLLLSVYYSNPQ